MTSTLTLASRPRAAPQPDAADRQEAIRSLALAAIRAVARRRAELGVVGRPDEAGVRPFD